MSDLRPLRELPRLLRAASDRCRHFSFALIQSEGPRRVPPAVLCAAAGVLAGDKVPFVWNVRPPVREFPTPDPEAPDLDPARRPLILALSRLEEANERLSRMSGQPVMAEQRCRDDRGGVEV